ncbi:unnamed protein product [Medioppia subpectinata]|uniref:Nuclear receptor domain-containing protein n=1 Tax=Medioppia subpectinata TaxID=1979941 RepID=A0A7R9L8Z0_9ACAR|nr:unnamed protein product [Medioppia subpectinata]CAG2116945.1 unnamed protein product [Medioppia subpectinata]
MGVNFDALTCGSCKAFFRRNAPKNMEFKCNFNKDCKIDVKSRKFCIKCRLNKCYAMGMKKDYILNDEERHKRYEKLMGIPRKKGTKCTKTPDSSPESDYRVTNASPPGAYPMVEQPVVRFNSQLAINNDSNTDGENEENPEPHLIYRIYANPMGQLNRPRRPLTDYGNQLNELEGRRLTELLNAMHIYTETVVPVTEFAVKNNYVMASQLDARVYSLIKMAKNLTAFNELCENDRKHKYHSDKSGCVQLTAIILFNPNRPNLINKPLIKLQQRIYMYLLQRYLLLRYRTDGVSGLKYRKLLVMINQLELKLVSIHVIKGVSE